MRNIISFQPQVKLTTDSQNKGKLIIAKLLISFGKLVKLNVEYEKSWSRKKRTMKTIDVGFKSIGLNIGLTTNLLENFNPLE